ncbi:hypothetical protein EV193_103262 [Herbihabitans rhizosphaerae]|uniref:Excreted virulence factor EspC (Type VII ESX diderm) n=1 Tax=Herbihabitans rhizosphaerae TaxID=1872711 RepID=A0A4Q7KW14_9PSEU|nr:hypothetical protein [Herbihabitans rhizosphaerae]RZS40944.1 hypothetical protein EV193_103262 [Herbihabitans rhizosphaerae]
MSGFEADPPSMRTVTAALDAAGDALRAAVETVDVRVCSRLGPERLNRAAAAVTEQCLAGLGRAGEGVEDSRERLDGALASYVDIDDAARESLLRKARWT